MSALTSTHSIGNSSKGLPILEHRFLAKSGAKNHVLILGGVHGDESEGVVCALGLIEKLLKLAEAGIPFAFNVSVIPVFNPDGVIAKKRVNGNGVDLNRNLPTKDWNPQAFNERYPPGPHAGSEPETKALVNWLGTFKPFFILSLHSFSRTLINTNGECTLPATAMHQVSGYPIEPSIGYPTPGCLGTYTGLERALPTITYEMLRGMPEATILSTHVEACFQALKALNPP